MGTQPENDNNRSSALSPEALGAINMATKSAVESAVAAVFASLKPVLEGMAVTPEKLREANRPWQDPAKIQRELRESLKSKQDEEDLRKQVAARQAACLHLDKNGRSAIGLVHNMPDHQPRGVCPLCSDWIHPREWRIGAPTEAEPRGKAYLVEPHRDYRTVMQLESMS